MSKETNFLIYCMERYRHFKGLSGEEVAKLFDLYNIYGYIIRYFEALHTMGDHCIVQDIDEYIGSMTKAVRCQQIRQDGDKEKQRKKLYGRIESEINNRPPECGNYATMTI